jgi:hypothetical protein
MNFTRSQNAIFLATAFLIAALGFAICYSHYSMSLNKSRRILFFMQAAPFSADPLEYDSFYHHVAFRSTFACLVSQYKLGEHTPELAESWVSNATQTEWRFKIRNGIKFSDGSPITPASIVQSWIRVAKAMHAKNSKSGFFENVEGYSNLKEDSESIAGLAIEGQYLTIKLLNPMPRLLDTISFGLYSVVHPSQYDAKTGKWFDDKHNIITSGPYSIDEWTDSRLQISLRKGFPEDLIHPVPIEKVEFFWDSLRAKNEDIDIAMGSSLTDPPGTSFTLHSGPASQIYFLRVLSWRDKKSIFSDRKNRIYFRNKFYEQMGANGIKIVRSFFPLIINGTKELQEPEYLSKFNFTLNQELKLPQYQKSAIPAKLIDNIIPSITNVATQLRLNLKLLPFNIKILFDEIKNQNPQTQWDLARYSTGILASSPFEDIKFMFLSKEGILLPDENGEILSEINKNTIDVQKVNELLWEQSIVWPITHFSSGLWAKPEFDFSQINLVLPPTAVQWIGWKN